MSLLPVVGLLLGSALVGALAVLAAVTGLSVLVGWNPEDGGSWPGSGGRSWSKRLCGWCSVAN